VEIKQYGEDYWKDLRLAWNIILRMRELGYHFRLSWNTYAAKMDATFIEADKPKNVRRQFQGRNEDPLEAIAEAMRQSWTAASDKTYEELFGDVD